MPVPTTPAAAPPPTTEAPSALEPTEPSRALGQGNAASCVEEYDLTTLVGRTFAFDGAVAAIAEETGSGEDLYVDVTFDVHEWFAAAGPDSIVIEMFPPGIQTSVGTTDYSVGSRLLISGEPRWGGATLDSPVAWMCGFSRTYDSATAAAWREAFNTNG